MITLQKEIYDIFKIWCSKLEHQPIIKGKTMVKLPKSLSIVNFHVYPHNGMLEAVLLGQTENITRSSYV